MQWRGDVERPAPALTLIQTIDLTVDGRNLEKNAVQIPLGQTGSANFEEIREPKLATRLLQFIQVFCITLLWLKLPSCGVQQMLSPV